MDNYLISKILRYRTDLSIDFILNKWKSEHYKQFQNCLNELKVLHFGLYTTPSQINILVKYNEYMNHRYIVSTW